MPGSQHGFARRLSEADVDAERRVHRQRSSSGGLRSADDGGGLHHQGGGSYRRGVPGHPWEGADRREIVPGARDLFLDL